MSFTSATDDRKRKRAQEQLTATKPQAKKIKSEHIVNGVQKLQNGDRKQDGTVNGYHISPEPVEEEQSRREIAQDGKEQASTNGLLTNGDTPHPTGTTESKHEVQSDESNWLSKKRRKLLLKIAKLKNRQWSSSDVEDELDAIAKQAEKLVTKHSLGPTDDLSVIAAQHKSRGRQDWRVSSASGGRFLDHDPVFSHDERYVMLATRAALEIYETQNSLLARKILVADGISCYALSTVDGIHVYIATRTGRILKFDWTTGEHLETITSPGGSISAIRCFRPDGTNEDVLLTIESLRPLIANKDWKKLRSILGGQLPTNLPQSLCVLRTAPWDESQSAYLVLHQFEEVMERIEVFNSGKAVFATGEHEVVIGTVAPNSNVITSASLADTGAKYRWRKLVSNSSISCICVHELTDQPRPMKKGKKAAISFFSYNLALGTSAGAIHLYRDFTHEVDQIQKSGMDKAPTPQILKWHRQAPAVVKWSKDGNYLISGGKETTLCLWQLETGQKQFLPHLTAAIRGLTVSPQGISYGVSLEDNSVIVLSTTELTPKTHIAGLQSLCAPESDLSNDDCLSHAWLATYSSAPLLSNPRDARQLLLAAPVDQQVSLGTTVPGHPFLQSYDIAAARSLSRQALTRNLVTEKGIDPDWNKIQVPNVTRMTISYDGTWLATLDEWTPPPHTLRHIAYDAESLEDEGRRRIETFLKIWLWNEEQSTWTLNTRIDTPHRVEADDFLGRTLDLVAHPTRNEFATLGEDGKLKIWQAKTTTSAGEKFWAINATYAIQPEETTGANAFEGPSQTAPATTTGHLAYSNDGSILAVSVSSDRSTRRNTLVQLLDAETGSLRSSEAGLAAGDLLAIGFLGRYLIVVSRELRVWDVVAGANVMTYDFKQNTLELSQRRATTHLAISVKDGTFAVAGLGINKDFKSSVLVFKPTSTKPLLSFSMDHNTVSALTTMTSGGFVMLDSQAEIRTITSSTAAPTDDVSLTVIGRTAGVEMKILEVDDMNVDGDDEATATTERDNDLQSGGQLLKGNELGQVLGSDSGVGLPSVKEMFAGLSRLLTVKI